MASYTTNLNLKKPAGSENVAIGDINNNMDAIDQAYGNLTADPTYKAASRVIPSNSDLNNYTTPGVYRIENSTAAASISNIPYTASGGRLEVLGQISNVGYQRQFYFPGANQTVFTRVNLSAGWGSWYKFDMTVVS